MATKVGAHPLSGKLLRLVCEDDPAAYTLSRFEADLGNGYLLARCLSPHTGEDLGASQVVAWARFARPDAAEVYDDWASFRTARDAGRPVCDHCADAAEAADVAPAVRGRPPRI